MDITGCNVILFDDDDKADFYSTVQILYESLRSNLSLKCDLGHVWEICLGWLG